MRVVGHKPLWLVVLALLAVAACGGEKIKVGDGKAASELKGRVLIAPVSGATVTAFKADGRLERGAALATATTNETGDFALSLPPYQGHVLLVATSGTYNEPSIGLGVQLGTTELAMLLPDFKTGSKPSGLRVTPVSTLAVEFARWHVVAKGEQPAAAYSDALVHLHQHFGGVDWAAITPADLTSDGVTNLSPEAKAGLVLAGFSWLSKTQAETSNVQPGLVLNAATLTTALAADSSDGTLDGKQVAAALSQGHVALTGLSMRNELVAAMSQFINSARNKSALRLADISAFMAAIGTNADPYLFCPGQVATEACGSGPVDTSPPTLTFIRPIDGAGIAGSAVVEVQATDNVKLQSLRFTAPASLAAAAPTWTNNQREGALSATLDVSALPDGPLEIRAEVADAAGNPAARSITIIVNNHGPIITVDAPSDNATVSGVVAISASASAQAGSITSLTLVSPPPGIGADTLTSASQFGAIWTTTQAPEGLTTLTFHAEDSLGGASDVTVRVNVDNVPFGVVTATATLGAPVGGLSLKLFAIDDATGLPTTTRVGGALLGETAVGVATDPNTGAASFTLSQENYDGPVQLVAQGVTATYADPSDETDGGVTTISLPTSFTITSYIARYRTGDALQVPLTGWTTLADEAALAFAQGKNPVSADGGTLTNALAVVDPLFPGHLSRPTTWPLRTVFPVSLTSSPQNVRDVVYAALPDVGLNQLARDIANDVGLTPGTGYALPQLLTSLRQDVSDGLFDGRYGSTQLVTGGVSPYQFDANATRFRLAVGMDRFVRGGANKTGLSRADMQTNGIYDNVSDDTSILYPAGVPPIAFDNVPPTVNWSVTYVNGAVDGGAPYVFSPTVQLVGGVVHVNAQATDATGVQSIAVDVNGVPMTPLLGSTGSLFKGTFDTRGQPVNTFTFTAQSCDLLANCASSTFTVTADNTAPTVNIIKPSVTAFFSAAMDVEAQASDSYVLSSFVVTPPAAAVGLVDQDALLGRITAPATTWSIGAMPDGLLLIPVKACDVVGNCSINAATPAIDRTAPVVNVTSNVPQYTNSATLNLSGTAYDGEVGDSAGVSRVWVQLDVAPPVEVPVSNGAWTANGLALTGTGFHTLKVWATDLALAPNSGQSVGGANVTRSLLLDQASPALSVVNFASYASEQGLNFARDASGKPVMPVQWQFANPSKVDISANGVQIYKATSRLSWGATRPTGAELEGPNPNNVPFLQIAVAYEPALNSPISSVVFRASAASQGSPTVEVPAIPAARTGSGFLYFDVPLTSDVIAWLPGFNAPGYGFTVTVTATDAAGNSASTSKSVLFSTVPPPVALVRDTGYESRLDPKSIYAYRVANQTYDDLWDPNNTNFSGDPNWRSDRWIVYNPAPSPVAVLGRAPTSDYSGKTTETWNLAYYPFSTSYFETYDMDGFTFTVGQSFNTIPNADLSCYSNSPAPQYVPTQFQSPCGVGTLNAGAPAHFLGDSARFRCITLPLTTLTTVAPTSLPYSSGLLFKAFSNPVLGSTGVESTSASPVFSTTGVDTGGFVVPAAVGNTPGAVAMYKSHSRNVAARTAAGGHPLTWQPNPYASTPMYQSWQGDHWVPTGQTGTIGCVQWSNGNTAEYMARHRWQQLYGAVSTITSSGIRLQTAGATEAGVIVGAFADWETQSRAVSFTH